MKALQSIPWLVLVGALALGGCQGNDGPMEEAGETMDHAVEETGEAIEEAGDEVREHTQ